MSYLPLQYETSKIFPNNIISLRPDVHMMYSAGDFLQNTARTANTTSPVFELTYSRENTLHGAVNDTPMEIRAGYTSLGFLGEVNGYSEYKSGEAVKLYSIWISPHAFDNFCEAVTGNSKTGFKSFMQGSYAYHNFKSDALEENLKRKLEACFMPGTNQVNRLLLESYLLELLSINIERLICPSKASLKLSKSDMEQMAFAREILLARLADPPSLMELSHILHMNDCKLKQTFKHCFGTTVYGFIRNQRMEKAFSMLEQGGCKVSEAAFSVGYTNVSHFSEAFKKKFGFTPSLMI